MKPCIRFSVMFSSLRKDAGIRIKNYSDPGERLTVAEFRPKFAEFIRVVEDQLAKLEAIEKRDGEPLGRDS